VSLNGSGVFTVNSAGQPVVAATLIDATVFNAFTADVATALSTAMYKDGQQTPTGNIPMGGFRMTNMGAGIAASDSAVLSQLSNGAAVYVSGVGGTANAITLTPSPAIAAYAAGQIFRFIVGTTNTGAVTIATSSLTARNLKKRTSGGLVAVVANDLIAGCEYAIYDDGTQYILEGVRVYSQGADVSSAGTVNLNTATGDYLHITGVTAITAITLAQGEERTIVFDGILTFTHGASLILPGAANITTAANDIAVVRGEASGVVRCVSYIKANGTAVVVATPTVTTVCAAVRQTVSGGPTDSNGLPNLSGSTGSTTVTTSNIASSAPLAVAAAYGFDNTTGKALDYFGFSTSNLSWTGLSTDGTMYLYVDVNLTTGAITTGSVTLAPTYQWGGTYSTTNNQHTYNIQEGVMKVGNGATASQVARVFVGQVTVAGSVVTAITWYAYNGRYVGPWVATLPGISTKISQNHNLGVSTSRAALQVLCTTTDNGFSVGDILEGVSTSENGGPYSAPLSVRSTTLLASTTTGNRTAWIVIPETGGSFGSMTAASWSYRFFVQRGW